MRRLLHNFRKDTSGVALVEFAIFLPLFVLSLAVVVEGSRIFFSYQGAVVGVRDAARFLARTAPGDICTVWGANGFIELQDSDLNDDLVGLVRAGMADETGEPPKQVVLGTVAASWDCVPPPVGETYRQTVVPIARVSATFTITYPLGSVFELNGFTLPTITHTVTDESRIFGV